MFGFTVVGQVATKILETTEVLSFESNNINTVSNNLIEKMSSTLVSIICHNKCFEEKFNLFEENS